MKPISHKQPQVMQRQLPRILRRGPPVPKRNPLLAYLIESVEKKEITSLPEASLRINLFDQTSEVALEEIPLEKLKFVEPESQGIDLPFSAIEDLCLVTEKEFSLLHKSFLDEFDVPSEKVCFENNNKEDTAAGPLFEACHSRSPVKSNTESINIKTELKETSHETKEFECEEPSKEDSSETTPQQSYAEESCNISTHENPSYYQENDLPVENTCSSNESSFICLEFEPVEIYEEAPECQRESTNYHTNELIDSEKCSKQNIPEIPTRPCTNSSVPLSMEKDSSCAGDFSYIQDEDSCSSSGSSFSCLEFEPIEIHEDADLQDLQAQTVFSTPESESAKVLSQSAKEETYSKVVSSNYLVPVTDDEKELELNNKPSSLHQRTKHSFEDSSPSRTRRHCELNTSLEGSFRQLRSQGQIQDNHAMSLRKRSKNRVDQKNYTSDNTRFSEKSETRNKHVTIMQNHNSGNVSWMSCSSSRMKKTKNDSLHGLHSSSVYQEQEPVTQSRKPSCDICGEIVKSSKQLKTHLKSQHKNLAKCTMCKANFGSLEQFKRRMLFKHTIDPVSCPVCGKQFLYKTSLKAHEMIHSNLKPFKCSDCGRGFNDSSSCRRHKRVLDIPLEQRKGLKCEICLKSFTRVACINYHRSINCEGPH